MLPTINFTKTFIFQIIPLPECFLGSKHYKTCCLSWEMAGGVWFWFLALSSLNVSCCEIQIVCSHIGSSNRKIKVYLPPQFIAIFNIKKILYQAVMNQTHLSSRWLKLKGEKDGFVGLVHEALWAVPFAGRFAAWCSAGSGHQGAHPSLQPRLPPGRNSVHEQRSVLLPSC